MFYDKCRGFSRATNELPPDISPGPYRSWALHPGAGCQQRQTLVLDISEAALLSAPGRPSVCPAACDRSALCCRFFAAGEADVSTFYIVLAGRVALACPAAAAQQSPVPAARKPALRSASSSVRLRGRGQSSRLRKTLSRPEASAESGTGWNKISEEVIAELGPGDSFGEEAIFSLGETDRDIAEATDTICALDYANRKYSAWRVSRDLEFLAVRDEEVLASLLQVRKVTGVCLGQIFARDFQIPNNIVCARACARLHFWKCFAL